MFIKTIRKKENMFPEHLLVIIAELGKKISNCLRKISFFLKIIIAQPVSYYYVIKKLG